MPVMWKTSPYHDELTAKEPDTRNVFIIIYFYWDMESYLFNSEDHLFFSSCWYRPHCEWFLNYRAPYDVMRSKHFLYYCPFVRENCRMPVDSPHIGPVIRGFAGFFYAILNTLLNKQPTCQTPWRSCDVTVMCCVEVDPMLFNRGGVSIRKTVLPGMAIPMLKIRRPNGRLIFNMEIAIRR